MRQIAVLALLALMLDPAHAAPRDGAVDRAAEAIDAAEFLANVTRLLGKDGEMRPYVALHAGAYWVEQELDIGLYAYTLSNWHFGMAPEVGLTLPMHSEASVYVNARYHYLFAAGEYLGGDSLTLPFLTLGVGIAWTS